MGQFGARASDFGDVTWNEHGGAQLSRLYGSREREVFDDFSCVL
jgi:hypothetical protein